MNKFIYNHFVKSFNSKQHQGIILHGNVQDLFFDGQKYTPLSDYIFSKLKPESGEGNHVIRVRFRLNSTLEILDKGFLADKANDLINSCAGNINASLNLINQLATEVKKFNFNLIVLIEDAELLFPNIETSKLNDIQLQRLQTVLNLLNVPNHSPNYYLCFISNSSSSLNSKLTSCPYLGNIEINYPTFDERLHYINSFDKLPPIWSTKEDLAKFTAGLSLHALRQLILSALYDNANGKKETVLSYKDIIIKVEEYIKSQLGEDIVEFKKPTHNLKDVVGASKLVKFINQELIPRFKADDDSVLSGAAIAGPIGCHKKGQLILMHNGECKKVEDIVPGDLLMGPDSQPRMVLELIRGFGKMCQIIPVKGCPFIVNEDHILSLKRTGLVGKKIKNGKKTNNKAGEVIDVKVKDYFDWSKTRKGLYKLFRVGVEFPYNENALTIDPYFLGVLLGDGGLQNSPNVTTLDYEIIKEIVQQSKIFKLRIRPDVQKTTKAAIFNLVGTKKKKNKIVECLKKLGLWKISCNKKFVPPQYLVSSRESRLSILAGLLDTDGSYGHNFDFTNTSEQLCDDVVFLARSLGLAAYKSGPHIKKSQNGTRCVCWRVSISGNLEWVPTRIPHKKATPRKQKKSVLVTGIEVNNLDIYENYFGFSLDGDGRYLLGDFTVTHNSGKTFVFEAVASELGLPVLVLKNIRSKWYGETDEIFEKLKNVLQALEKVVIFVDEADTQFGSLSGEEHSTERRLTGKIQSMMSDVKLKGKVIWLLMTARINKLSADIRRPGRVGDLIIPVLDPTGQDRIDFIKWVLKPFTNDEDLIKLLDEKLAPNYSAASFSSLRSYLKSICKDIDSKDLREKIIFALEDQMPSAIEITRRYQTLQALINCTRKSLLPEDCGNPEKWLEEIKELEIKFGNI